MFLPIFHLSVLAINCFTIWYDHKYVDLPFPKKIGEFPLKARPLFLTVWCFALQTLYFAFSFLNDIAGSNATTPKNPPLIRKVKDIIFSLAFPVAIYVSLVFWSMYFLHKDLIFPDEFERKFPVFQNHVMHTLIVPFIFIELFATRRNYPSRLFGVKAMVYFMCSYTVFPLGAYFKYGAWVYPFLEFFDWPTKIAFTLVSFLIGIGFYILGEKLNYAVSHSSNAVSHSSKVYVNGKKH